MSPNIYTAYRGDDLVAIGTKKELARALGVKVSTIGFYTTPAWRKRRGENSTAVLVVKIDMEEEG